MKAKPIIFSGDMSRALREGCKQQTRRVMDPQPEYDTEFINEPGGGLACYGVYWKGKDISEAWRHCPYGQPGDFLWVRESWRPMPGHSAWDLLIKYAADGPGNSGDRHIEDGDVDIGDWSFPKAAKNGFVSPIFMPRWASRTTLEITGINAIPLQEISTNDIVMEGVKMPEWNPDTGEGDGVDPWGVFADAWDRINAKRGYSWDSNPFVWRLKFKVHKMNIDRLAGRGRRAA